MKLPGIVEAPNTSAETIAWALAADPGQFRWVETNAAGSIKTSYRVLTLNVDVDSLLTNFKEITGMEPVFRDPSECSPTENPSSASPNRHGWDADPNFHSGAVAEERPEGHGDLGRRPFISSESQHRLLSVLTNNS